MQLILEAETSVDVNPKMSLNEESVDKCASDVVTAAQNGCITKGDEESIEKCVSEIVTCVENGTNSECIANGEGADNNDAFEAEKSNAIEEVNQVKESETNNTDNVLEDANESTIITNANNNIEPNDIDANTDVEKNVDIKEKPDETAIDGDIKMETSEDIEMKESAVSGDIKAEISEDIDIKEEITESHGNENSTESASISQHLSEQTELPETNKNDTNQIEIKTETTETIPLSGENDTMEENNTEFDTSEENIDLIRLDASLHEGNELRESCDQETEKAPLSTVDTNVEESSKLDDVIEMDVDTSINHIDIKETNKTGSPAIVKNTTEKTESKNTEQNKIVSKETEELSQPDIDSSTKGIVNLEEEKEKPVDSVKVENNSNLIKPNDDKPVIDCDDDIGEAKNVERRNSMSVDDIIDLDETVLKDPQDSKREGKKIEMDDANKFVIEESTQLEPVLKLSNTLDILSDDEEEQVTKSSNTDNKCINIEDDDDVMLIDDDTSGNEGKPDPVKPNDTEKQAESKPESPSESVKVTEDAKSTELEDNVPQTDTTAPDTEVTETIAAPEIGEKKEENKLEAEMKKPLIPENFLKTCKKNLADMKREELEEFCILKIVESILDRSNLSEIKNKLKTLTQNLEEYKKKAMMLSKQNRDLQVVFKSVQEDVKKSAEGPIVPLKITRSVGMQVLMSDKPDKRRKVGIGLPNTPANKQVRNPVQQGPRPQKPPTQQIPVPRLVPANSPVTKSPQQAVNTSKTTSPLPNGVKSVSPVQKGEKRPHNRVQSVTVDLTDDEPPAKVVNRQPQPTVPPVRLVPSQNLLAPPRPTAVNSPRKVYIPISGPQGQNIRPGQTIMLKSVPSPSPRPRVPPHMVRLPQTVRVPRPQGLRHPAPLPECMKQYQPPNWKALPPAPDLKLAKVENGIVISWKIEGYQEDSYEEIASYQLYAYQETSSPPNTALWKKIGDVKALPLPMACTLTQFMAGYKYYFAVRAVDIRSRLGPFSLPGSILLLNKM